MAGLTPEGFLIKRMEEIFTGLQDAAKAVFQDILPPGEELDVSEGSVLGRLLGIVTPAYSDLWETAEDGFNAFDPSAATGVALENVVALGGLVRQGAQATSVPCLFRGDVGTNIPSGSFVSSSTTGKRFTTSALFVLDATDASGIVISVLTVADSTNYNITYTTSGSPVIISTNSGAGATAASILSAIKTNIDTNFNTVFTATISGTTLIIDKIDPFQTSTFTTTSNLGINKVAKVETVVCEETGPIEQAVNTVDTIVTPVLGWDSVLNPSPGTTGRDIETDEELRLRFLTTKALRGSSTIDGIFSAVNDLSGVENLAVYENDTTTTDVNGLPAHSFMVVVEGGFSSQIAQAIWENKPAGITTVGNTTIQVLDTQGFPHNIKFERPASVGIYISINITKDTAVFPQDGEQLIKDALVAHFEALRTGDDVIYSRLYTPINSVAGHQVNSLFVGTSPSPTGTSNVVVAFNNRAFTDNAKVVITVS